MYQGSNEWHTAREGRFTASAIHKLLGVKGLGETGKSYAFEKAVEVVFGRDDEPQFVSFDIQRGNELEPIAFSKFQELKGMDFVDVEVCTFFPLGPDAGASPDGLVGDNAILEIKCPRPNKFFNLVANGIEAIDKEYIAQMQMQMLCTNSVQCHFFNFIIYKGQPMWHELIVMPDVNMQTLIKERIAQAVIERDKFIKLLNEKKQF